MFCKPLNSYAQSCPIVDDQRRINVDDGMWQALKTRSGSKCHAHVKKDEPSSTPAKREFASCIGIKKVW